MTSRRDFLKKLAVNTAVLSAGSILPGMSAKSYRSIIGANDKIRVAAIGVNSRGNALAGGFAAEKGCEVTYVCDVDSRAAAKCVNNITKIAGNKPKTEKDIRIMLDSKDFDAVIVATPDHWHAPAAVMAMQAGKHVYLEKPTSHNPAENELLIKATSKYNRIVQVGNQRRSWPNVINAIKEVRSGAIGDVNFGKSWYVNNRPSIGTGNVVPVPEWLDWDLWQGPAPRVRDFKDNYVHYNWHWFWHWGTGEALNNGTHFVDILRWGMDLDYPTKVSSVGGRYSYKDDWQTPDTQVISFDFNNEKSMIWEGRSCNNKYIEDYSVGCVFYGTKGSLVLGGGNEYKIYDQKNKLINHVTSEMSFESGNLSNPTKNLDAYHFRNFMDGIRQGTPLNAGIVDGCISTLLVQLGNISQRTGRTLSIDSSNGMIKNDKKAAKLWSRDYEKDWDLKL